MANLPFKTKGQTHRLLGSPRAQSVKRRIKLIKPQMYQRGNLDILEARPAINIDGVRFEAKKPEQLFVGLSSAPVKFDGLQFGLPQGQPGPHAGRFQQLAVRLWLGSD